MVSINLKGFDIQKPFLRFVTHNDSMPDFVKKVQSFFMTDLEKYTSATKALADFSNLIFSKVDANIMYTEIMLKAALITSSIDYRIPIITDPDNVRFGTLPNIIPNRSIGGMMAYEQFYNYITNPLTYLTPKMPGIFDPHLAFLD
jgi:hypothetical protein